MNELPPYDNSMFSLYKIYCKLPLYQGLQQIKHPPATMHHRIFNNRFMRENNFIDVNDLILYFAKNADVDVNERRTSCALSPSKNPYQ